MIKTESDYYCLGMGSEPDIELFEKFLKYFLYERASVEIGSHLFRSRATGTWRILLQIALKVWGQARRMGIELFPFSGEKLLATLGAVKRGEWSARTWLQVQQYIKIVYALNGHQLDQRVVYLIGGQAKGNIVVLERPRKRVVGSPAEIREVFRKIKRMWTSHAQQRSLLALFLSYFAVGRAYDLSHLRGEHLEYGRGWVKVHYGIRKNNKLGLKRQVATLYATGSDMCPVSNVLAIIAYLGIGSRDYVFHKQHCRREQMRSSAIIAAVKATQERAGCDQLFTLTDMRASATTTLADRGVSAFNIKVNICRFE